MTVKRALASLSLIVLLLSPGTATEPQAWARDVARASAVTKQTWYETFELTVVRSDGDSLRGFAVATRHPSKDRIEHAPLIIEGVNKDDRFWPRIKAEVTDNPRNNWIGIEAPGPEGILTTRHVQPHSPGQTCFVKLDSFVPYIGRKRYGRAGEAAPERTACGDVERNSR